MIVVLCLAQTTRALKQKNDKFHGNITKRGNAVPVKKENTPPVGPIVLGFFLFVVVGSGMLFFFQTTVTGLASDLFCTCCC